VTSPRDTPRLSVVVITWNEREELARCLDALAAHPASGGQEVIVVDNASTDGTDAVLARHPRVRVIRNAENRGVTVARNQGLARARGRYVAMLDSDAYVGPGALERLCAHLDDNPDVGMVGPELRYEDGSLQMSCRRVPSPLAVIANRLPGVARLHGGRARRRYLMLDEPHDRTMDVEYLLGATMVFSREAAARIGRFDERFGFSTPGGYGFDDADWAVRLRRAGRRVVYLPAAKVVHGYRRRLAKQPVSRQSLGLALSYLMLRIKHAGALGRPASSEGLAVVAGAGRPAFQVALQHD
jgi:GT2 family glycosyltransferase